MAIKKTPGRDAGTLPNMAGRDATDTGTEAGATEDARQGRRDATDTGTKAGATGPPASDYVVIVNRTQGNLSCHLSNGRVVNVGPRVTGRRINRSEPILKKFVTPLIRQWERKGMVAIEPQGGE